MPDGREVWETSPCDYVKNAIKTVEGLLAEDKEGYVAIEKQGKESIPYELSSQVECVR
jgi:hypothetical protein